MATTRRKSRSVQPTLTPTEVAAKAAFAKYKKAHRAIEVALKNVESAIEDTRAAYAAILDGMRGADRDERAEIIEMQTNELGNAEKIPRALRAAKAAIVEAGTGYLNVVSVYSGRDD